MLRKHIHQLAIALTLSWGLGLLGNGWLFGQSADVQKCDRELNSVAAAPADNPLANAASDGHSKRVPSPPLGQELATDKPSTAPNQSTNFGDALGNSSTRVNQRVLPMLGAVPQPQALSPASSPAVTLPISDETERAIAEVRSRLGNSGGRFSGLLSPGDEARMFAEALSQVRQEQPPQTAPEAGPRPSTALTPPLPPCPLPPQLPGPALPGPPAVLPPLVAAPPTLPSGRYPTIPRLQWAPGEPTPPQPPAWAAPHAIVHLPQASRQETEQTAMRRIASQIDALAEQLENLKRYAEADSLRRSAQQFREAVR